MDIRQLKHLDALAQTGSFTAAAKMLHMAQPALSQSIKRLEAELGVTLVDRHSHKPRRQVSFTAEGEALHHHAKIIIKQLNQAKAQIKAMANLTQGEVRIAVPGMLGSYYLPSRLMAFKHRYPELKLSLFEGGTKDTLKMLQNEEVDIAIITAENLSDEFDSRLLVREQMVVAVGTEHDLASKSTITLKEFVEQELVMFKTGYFHREWLINESKALNKELNIAFETNLINLIKQIVSQGFAITSVLEMVINPKDGILSKPFSPPVYIDLHIAWKKARPVSQADRAFVEFLTQD